LLVEDGGCLLLDGGFGIFVEMFVGVGASRAARSCFKRAKEKAPCIIFIE